MLGCYIIGQFNFSCAILVLSINSIAKVCGFPAELGYFYTFAGNTVSTNGIGFILNSTWTGFVLTRQRLFHSFMCVDICMFTVAAVYILTLRCIYWLVLAISFTPALLGG